MHSTWLLTKQDEAQKLAYRLLFCFQLRLNFRSSKDTPLAKAYRRRPRQPHQLRNPYPTKLNIAKNLTTTQRTPNPQFRFSEKKIEGFNFWRCESCEFLSWQFGVWVDFLVKGLRVLCVVTLGWAGFDFNVEPG